MEIDEDQYRVEEETKLIREMEYHADKILWNRMVLRIKEQNDYS